ncbi:hypothetical protein Bca52824_074040 [Brassica carinata]|uniref:START domain-containing protein n=1 Tax=Brassica carinata TaxID=52824 RepID=A0A8X7U8J3_BRACI|nr:hypothetical protein Bca52824_074040 [Brassica carinata]
MDKSLTINIDVTAMKELLRLTQTNEPLWIKTDGCLDVLSLKSYENAFPRLSSRGGKNHNLRVEVIDLMALFSLMQSKLESFFLQSLQHLKLLEWFHLRLRGNHGDALHLTTT